MTSTEIRQKVYEDAERYRTVRSLLLEGKLSKLAQTLPFEPVTEQIFDAMIDSARQIKVEKKA